MPILLSATNCSDCNGNRVWVGYLKDDNYAVPLTVCNDLDDLRSWAESHGYYGVSIGNPIVPFRTFTPEVGIVQHL